MPALEQTIEHEGNGDVRDAAYITNKEKLRR